MVRLRGRRLKERIGELRRATSIDSVGLRGPSVKLNRTTSTAIAEFVRGLRRRGVLFEAWEFEVKGAVARSIDELRAELAQLERQLPRNDPEHASVGELVEACRVFSNRHNPDLNWDDFTTKLGQREMDALKELRQVFAAVLLDWYDNKGIEEAREILLKIPLEREKVPWLPP